MRTHQQYADNLTWAHGRHTVKFGGDAVVDKIFNYFPGNFFGAYRFNNLEAFGASLNGTTFAVGNTNASYAQAFPGAGTTGPVTAPDILQASWFVQEDWRVNAKLTINAGLRYDIQSVKQPGTQNATAETLGFDTSKVPIKKNEWGPRFGFAYTPGANNRFVVRGGYGFFYGTTPSLMVGTAHSNNGINVGTYTLAAQPYQNTIYTAPSGSGATPSIYVFAPNFQNPRIQQGNLGVEYAINKNTSINVSYLRVKGDHLQRTGDVNLGTTSLVGGGDLNGDSNSSNDRLPGIGRNFYTMPATWEFDPRISRTVKLHGETTNLQFIAEAFNLFNHFNVSGVRNTAYALKSVTASNLVSKPCGPGSVVGQTCLVQQFSNSTLNNLPTAGTTYFGLPTSNVGPRTIQLAVKFNF